MIDIDKAIYTALTNDTTVAATVATRVYPGTSPEGLYPMLAFETAKQPSSALNSSIFTAFEVTITAEAEARDTAKALHDAAVTALEAGGTHADITLRGAFEAMPPITTEFTTDSNPETSIWEVEGTVSILATEL